MYRSQLGSVLIWMMFLLLIVSSSSLMVVKQSKAQLVLVSHYDEGFKKKRALRRIQRQVQMAIEQHFGDLKEDKCFPVSRHYHPCLFEDVDHSLWKISTRGLLLSEHVGVADSKGCTNNAPIHRVVVQWRSEVLDAGALALFRVCQVEQGEGQQWFVKREMLWSETGV